MPALLGLLYLAVAYTVGGWPWTLVGMVALGMLWRTEFTVASVIALCGINLLWLGLFHWTEDRRLFFPYSMQFAVQAGWFLTGRWARGGGAAIVAVFALIRIYQGATPFVLFVELSIAALILLGTEYSKRKAIINANSRVVAGALGSVLAFAGLVVN